MAIFVDQHKEQYGIEPICKQIQIAPSSYYEHKARQRDPERLADRVKRDRALERDIQRIWEKNFKVYGADKVWRQLLREGIRVARCTVERLMKRLGIQGVRRGKKCRTTIADDLLARPTDKVKRQFVATRPNQLWVADITFVATWTGFVYVAFITDVFARYIVGWRVSAASISISSRVFSCSRLQGGRVFQAWKPLSETLSTRYMSATGYVHRIDSIRPYLTAEYIN